MKSNYNAELTDEQLIELSKNNPDDFAELVCRYQEKLFWYVKRISYFSPEDIEDIIQEVFIKIYKNLNNFDTHLKFSSWAYQIARNATVDAIRKKQARPQSYYLEEGDLTELFKASTDIQRDAISKEELSKTKDIINRMPFKYREVMVLRFLEEKSYEEIMDILKKPKGTIATLINRGRKLVVEKTKNIVM